MSKQRTRTQVFGAVMLVAIGGATFAQVHSGGYTDAKTDSLAQPRAPAHATDAEYSAAPYSSLPAELAEGEGLAETQSLCVSCHSTRYIIMQPPLPAAVWEAEMNKMTKTYGASIPEASAKKILAYLQTHYTPETRKK